MANSPTANISSVVFIVFSARLSRMRFTFRRVAGILTQMSNYMIADLNAIEPTRCPCGWAQRAFATPDNTTATIHLTTIDTDALTHYHKKMTEIYLFLEGQGQMKLDGERVPVKPMTAVFIK